MLLLFVSLLAVSFFGGGGGDAVCVRVIEGIDVEGIDVEGMYVPSLSFDSRVELLL